MARRPLRNRPAKSAADLHRAWLELVDTEGPFLAIPPLKRVWPNGIPDFRSAHPDRFDTVITDERMPGLSGTALIGALHRLRPALPVLLVTGFLGAEEVRRAQAAGAGAVLGKPLATRDLARALAQVLAPLSAPG